MNISKRQSRWTVKEKRIGSAQELVVLSNCLLVM